MQLFYEEFFLLELILKVLDLRLKVSVRLQQRLHIACHFTIVLLALLECTPQWGNLVEKKRYIHTIPG